MSSSICNQDSTLLELVSLTLVQTAIEVFISRHKSRFTNEIVFVLGLLLLFSPSREGGERI